MKFRNLSFRKGFRVHRGNRRSEAAEMVIEPGGAEGEPENRHRHAASVTRSATPAACCCAR